MEFHVRRGHSRGKLGLRGLEVCRGKPKPKPALQRVGGAACDDRQAACHEELAHDGSDTCGIGLEGRDARTSHDCRPGRDGPRGQRAIEHLPVDDGGHRNGAGVWNGQPGRGNEPGSGELIQRGLARQVEFVEALGREDTSAMNGIPDAVVLFTHQDVGTCAGQARCRKEPRRTGAGNEHIDSEMLHESGHYKGVLTLMTAATGRLVNRR